MIVFYLVALAHASTRINTDRELRFPISFLFADESVPGTANLRLSETRDRFFGDDAQNVDRTGFNPALWLRFPQIWLRFGENEPHNLLMPEVVRGAGRSMLPSRGQHVELSATPHSTFARSVSSFLITPASPTEKLVVLNPENPEEFALDNQIFYAMNVVNLDWAQLFGHRDFWGVNATIRLANQGLTVDEIDPNLPFHPCVISDRNDELISVPSRVIRDFIQVVTTRGIRATREREPPHRIFLNDVDDETVASLPNLQYVVQSEDGSHVSIIDLPPHEYIVPFPADPNIRHVRLHLTAIRSYCEINTQLWKGIVLHFDTQNQRIGFGEPLVEL